MVLQWTDHGGGKRDEGTGMDLGIPGGCCSGQTMVEEREMKEQGWTWGFLDGVEVHPCSFISLSSTMVCPTATPSRNPQVHPCSFISLSPTMVCPLQHHPGIPQIMVGEREMKDQGWTWGFLEGVAVDRPWWGKER